jgi:hypothetical protein
MHLLIAFAGAVVVAVGTGLLSPAVAQARAEDDLCIALMGMEAEMNPTLPRPIDDTTELVQIRVNCENKTISYTKRLLVDPTALAEGWQERKQRQYIQLHCNKDGLASLSKWTAMDLFYGPSFQYLITFTARPKDCP